MVGLHSWITSDDEFPQYMDKLRLLLDFKMDDWSVGSEKDTTKPGPAQAAYTHEPLLRVTATACGQSYDSFHWKRFRLQFCKK